MRFTAHHLARFLGPAVLCAAGLLLCAPAATAADAASSRVRWIAGADATRPVVELNGVDAATLARLRAAGPDPAPFRETLRVFVLPPAGSTPVPAPDQALPAMAGSYRLDGDVVVFSPGFPLVPGITYVASVPGPGGTDYLFGRTYTVPPKPVTAATTVTAVYPSADVLPENLLKFYIHFSAPMNRGDIYKYIHLLDAAGKPVYLPFLELGEELWNPAMTRVTVFIDPGRIKRGVRELMEHGPALTVGKTHTLVIDAAWTDGNGQPLKESFRKTFRVEKDDRIAIDPKQWKIASAPAGSKAALVITFPEPLDHALAERLIQVVALAGGTRRTLTGTATLSDQERRLSFVPDQPWTAGPHELEIPTILEDLAGNKVGKVFDVDVFEEVTRTVTPDTVALPFAVK